MSERLNDREVAVLSVVGRLDAPWFAAVRAELDMSPGIVLNTLERLERKERIRADYDPDIDDARYRVIPRRTN